MRVIAVVGVAPSQCFLPRRKPHHVSETAELIRAASKRVVARGGSSEQAATVRFLQSDLCNRRCQDPTANDAERHTHKATSLDLQELWGQKSPERTGSRGRTWNPWVRNVWRQRRVVLDRSRSQKCPINAISKTSRLAKVANHRAAVVRIRTISNVSSRTAPLNMRSRKATKAVDRRAVHILYPIQTPAVSEERKE